MKNKLMSSAPWRGEEEAQQFEGANLKVTKQPGSTPTMLVPGQKKSVASKSKPREPIAEIDPELRYSFQRNTQFLRRVFSIDTIVKPLPPGMAYYASRNLSFFTRIFTQFFDPEGISNAQKSLGVGARRESASCALNYRYQSPIWLVLFLFSVICCKLLQRSGMLSSTCVSVIRLYAFILLE